MKKIAVLLITFCLSQNYAFAQSELSFCKVFPAFERFCVEEAFEDKSILKCNGMNINGLCGIRAAEGIRPRELKTYVVSEKICKKYKLIETWEVIVDGEVMTEYKTEKFANDRLKELIAKGACL